MKLLLVAALLLLAGCGGLATQHDYDPTYEFLELRTYKWVPPPDDERVDLFVVRHTEAAVHKELKARGYAPSEAPDCYVVMRGWFDHHKGRGSSLGLREDARRRSRGAIILEILDAETREVVWWAIAEQVIAPDDPPERRRKNIHEAVPELLKDFPPSA